MSIEFTSSNPYLHVGFNRGNINIFTEPRPINFSGDAPLREERDGINATTILALNLVLFKAQISLDKIVCDVCISERVCNPCEIFSLLHAPKQIRNA